MNGLHLTLIGLDPDGLHRGRPAPSAFASHWQWPEHDRPAGPLAERVLHGRHRHEAVAGLSTVESHCADDPDRLAVLALDLPQVERERVLERGWAFWRWRGDCRLLAEAGHVMDAMPAGQGAISLLEPVHLKAETDHAVVFGSRFLALSESEIRSLFADFAHWLHADGLRLLHGRHGRAYLLHPPSSDPASALLGERDLAPLAEALNRNAEPLLSSDAALRPLRRWLTEVQMWLHGHPVNEARARRGLPEVNSFWLHGRTELSPASRQQDEAVAAVDIPPFWTDSALLLGAFPQAAVWHPELNIGTDGGRVVLTEPGWCWLEGDVAGWHQALDTVDRWLAEQLAANPKLRLRVDNGRGDYWQPAGGLLRAWRQLAGLLRPTRSKGAT